jgi:uncharacterized repeat protein (TIGR02543 family)
MPSTVTTSFSQSGVMGSLTAKRVTGGVQLNWTISGSFSSARLSQTAPTIIPTLFTFTPSLSTGSYTHSVNDGVSRTYQLAITPVSGGSVIVNVSIAAATVTVQYGQFSIGTFDVQYGTNYFSPGDTVAVDFTNAGTLDEAFSGWSTDVLSVNLNNAPTYSLSGTTSFIMPSSNVQLAIRYNYKITFAPSAADNFPTFGPITNIPAPIYFNDGTSSVTIPTNIPLYPVGPERGFLGWLYEYFTVMFVPGQQLVPGVDFTKTNFTLTTISSPYGVVYDADAVVGVASVPPPKFVEEPSIDPDTGDLVYTSIEVAAGPTRSGYTFGGWLDDSSNLYNPGDSITLTGYITLTAQWTPVYTVTYNGNSGNTTISDTVGYEEGDSVTVKFTPTPTRSNYTFAGWNTADNGTGTTYTAAGTNSFLMPASNVTLYARWTPLYTVTYNGNSGNSTISDTVGYAAGTYVTVKFTPTPTRSNYTFSGWNTASDGSGTSYTATGTNGFTMPGSDVTLYAQWTEDAKYSVSYVGNGVTFSYNDPSTYYAGASVTVQFSSLPTRSNYTFAGWNTADNGTGTTYTATGTNSFLMPGANVTLYAMWSAVSLSPSKFKVTYAAGGSGVTGLPSQSADITSGDPYILSATVPSRSGYTFAGWTNGATTYNAEDLILSVSSNIILTAQWTTVPPSPGVVCFLGYAPVLTPTGWMRIDSLAVGDLVRTADGRDVAIQRVKHQRIERPSAAVNPFVIPAGQWGATENLPISPRHCIAVPGRGMIEARELGLRQMSMRAAFDYYNLELPEWDNMIVAGVEVESLAPKKQVVMTLTELAALAATVPTEKRASLARLVTVLADGRITVQMSPKTRRMRV